MCMEQVFYNEADHENFHTCSSPASTACMKPSLSAEFL